MSLVFLGLSDGEESCFVLNGGGVEICSGM